MDRRTLTMDQFDRLSLVDREAVNAWCRANQLDGTIEIKGTVTRPTATAHIVVNGTEPASLSSSEAVVLIH